MVEWTKRSSGRMRREPRLSARKFSLQTALRNKMKQLLNHFIFSMLSPYFSFHGCSTHTHKDRVHTDSVLRQQTQYCMCMGEMFFCSVYEFIRSLPPVCICLKNLRKIVTMWQYIHNQVVYVDVNVCLWLKKETEKEDGKVFGVGCQDEFSAVFES